MGGYDSDKPKSPNYLKLCLIVGLAVVAIIYGYLLYQRIANPTTPPAPPKKELTFPVYGIDVSQHNGNVNFDKVAKDGYTFVYIKATQGDYYVDPCYERNYTRALKAGLYIGFYHYFRMDLDGHRQALNLLKAAQGKHLDLPLVVDVEDPDGIKKLMVSEDKVRASLREMIATLKKKGKRVMIYTNRNGKKKYYNPDFKGELLWLCTFEDPSKAKYHKHTIQQFSHWGKVDGIKGDVDIDVFMGSIKEWEKFIDN